MAGVQNEEGGGDIMEFQAQVIRHEANKNVMQRGRGGKCKAWKGRCQKANLKPLLERALANEAKDALVQFEVTR